MENNPIKVQLASSAVLHMKIESKQKNKVEDGQQSFAHVLNEIGEKKVWDTSIANSLKIPTSYSDMKIWNGAEDGYQASIASLSSNAESFSTIINEASERYGVPKQIIQAVIQAESSFNPTATSTAGAKGLMQLMDGTAKGLGVVNSYDPEQNIFGGTKYLSMLLKKYDGHLQAALAAYNAGPTKVDRTGISTNEDFIQHKSALPTETQNYVSKVLSYI